MSEKFVSSLFFFNSCLARNSRTLICFPGGEERCCFFFPLCTMGKSSHAGCLDCTVRSEAASTGDCWLGCQARMDACQPSPVAPALWGCAGPCRHHPWGLGTGSAAWFSTQHFTEPKRVKCFGNYTSLGSHPWAVVVFCWLSCSGFRFLPVVFCVVTHRALTLQ